MFVAHAKRKAVEQVQRMKDSMVSGIWANSNYDDEQDSRTKLLNQVDSFVTTAVARIYGEDIEEETLDMDSPFFAAMKVPEVQEIDHSLTKDQVGELQ